MIMKIKSFMMMVAAAAFMMSVSSCSSSNNDEPEVPLASQVVGSYTGQEILTVDGEPDEGTATFVFTKASDIAVDMTIPEYGMGMMTLPALPVKNITLTKSGNTITGKLASYAGSVKNASGDEKSYTISDITVIFNGNTVVTTFTMKYGNMPFAFEGWFTGETTKFD